MDQVSTGDETRDSVGSRRSRMRTVARSRRKVASPVSDHFQTPAWLERSFVLPLTKPEQTNVPEPRPHRDHVPQQSMPQQPGPETEDSPAEPRAQDLGSPEVSTPDSTAADLTQAPAFIRPPSDDIDFGTVVRRADRSRSALRTAWVSTGVAGVLLILFLLTRVPAIAVLVAMCAVVAVSATVVRIHLVRAPVPRVPR